MDATVLPTTGSPPRSRSAPFDLWGGRAAMASPFVALFGVSVGASLYAREVGEVASSAPFVVAAGAGLIALVLLAVGLVALFLRHQEAIGDRLGAIGFSVALAGTILAAGGAWDQVFTVPHLAETAPSALDAEASGSLLVGYLVSFATCAVGWLLFGVACRRSGACSRGATTVLIAGAVLMLVPAPTALRILVLAVGAGLLARPPAEGARRRGRAGAAAVGAAALLLVGCGGGDEDTSAGERSDTTQSPTTAAGPETTAPADPLTAEETADRIGALVGEASAVVQSEFHPIFGALEGLAESDVVPTEVHDQLAAPAEAVATELRRVADEVDALEPPVEAEEAVAALTEAARSQADQLDALVGAEEITLAELGAAIMPPTEALAALADAGIDVPLPEGGA